MSLVRFTIFADGEEIEVMRDNQSRDSQSKVGSDITILQHDGGITSSVILRCRNLGIPFACTITAIAHFVSAGATHLVHSELMEVSRTQR